MHTARSTSAASSSSSHSFDLSPFAMLRATTSSSTRSPGDPATGCSVDATALGTRDDRDELSAELDPELAPESGCESGSESESDRSEAWRCAPRADARRHRRRRVYRWRAGNASLQSRTRGPRRFRAPLCSMSLRLPRCDLSGFRPGSPMGCVWPTQCMHACIIELAYQVEERCVSEEGRRSNNAAMHSRFYDPWVWER